MLKQISLSAFFFCMTLNAIYAQWQEIGNAKYYADRLHGRPTSSGEIYDKNALTAAHGSLPVGSLIRVTRLDTYQAVNVRVNDCCVACAKGDGTVVDLSRAAAEMIDLLVDGKAQVKIELIAVGDGKPCCGKSVQQVATTQSQGTAKSYSYDSPRVYSEGADRLTARGVTPAPSTVTPKSPIASAEGTYRVEALKPIEKGYGVQIGAFSQMANAEKRIEELKKKGFTDILINIDKKDKKAPYSIIMGPFESQKNADAYRKSLLGKYKIKGFVVEL